MSEPFIAGLLWNKLYKAQLFEGIRMPCYKASEDNATSYKVMDKTHKTVVIPNKFYHYVQRDTSTEHNIVIENHFISVKVAQERYKYISEKYPELENIANQNRWNIYTAMYKRLFFVNKQKENQAVLAEWLEFFKNNQPPTQEYAEERRKILKSPYGYGKRLGFVYRLKRRIKNILKR